MKERISCVYAIINNVTYDFYIGSSVDFEYRKKRHWRMLRNNKHHAIKLQNSYNKHGEDKFEFNIIEYVLNAKTRYDLIIPEQKWMDFFKPRYNSSPTANSCLGIRHSDEIKNKFSEIWMGVPKPWLRGLKRSPEDVEANRQRQLGKKYSQETNNKKGRKGEEHHFFGKNHSEDMRKKQSEGQARWNASRKHKTVYQYNRDTHELIGIYEDLWKCEIETGIKRKKIYKVIGYDKFGYGFIWSYNPNLFEEPNKQLQVA